MTDNIVGHINSGKKADLDYNRLEQDPPRNARSGKDFADLINTAWRKGPKAFMEVGSHLREANQELSKDEFNALLSFKLNLHDSVCRKLMRSAGNPILCAHVHILPACWSTIYELSKLTDDVLNRAIADGRVNPKMSRKDAVALRKGDEDSEEIEGGGVAPSSSHPKLSFATAWDAASPQEIQAKLDAVGREGLCAVMSDSLKADFCEHIIGQASRIASRTSKFAVAATHKLHTALYYGAQGDLDADAISKMHGALKFIVQAAEREGLTPPNLVIAAADPKPKPGRKK